MASRVSPAVFLFSFVLAAGTVVRLSPDSGVVKDIRRRSKQEVVGDFVNIFRVLKLNPPS